MLHWQLMKSPSFPSMIVLINISKKIKLKGRVLSLIFLNSSYTSFVTYLIEYSKIKIVYIFVYNGSFSDFRSPQDFKIRLIKNGLFSLQSTWDFIIHPFRVHHLCWYFFLSSIDVGSHNSTLLKSALECRRNRRIFK